MVLLKFHLPNSTAGKQQEGALIDVKAICLEELGKSIDERKQGTLKDMLEVHKKSQD